MNILNKVTEKTLRKNKVRTLVTIAGIILSAAMLTAVMTLISSLQQYMINIVVAQSGDWHGVVYSTDAETLEKTRTEDEVRSLVYTENIGYAKYDDIQNESKPFIYVIGANEEFCETMPVNILSGRMPQNDSEIMLPRHLNTNGAVALDIGDTITLDIGKRVSEGYELFQQTPYTYEEETIEVAFTKTYTVVGIYARPGFEDYMAPGYTAITVANNDAATFDMYIKMKDAMKVYDFIPTYTGTAYSYNNDLLRFIGVSLDSVYLSTLISLGAILTFIIVLASISLIYNAFSISLSERKKQFGILSSIGATKKQLAGSVLFEAFILSVAGIPLGILSGIAGIGVTLKCTEGLWDDMFLDSSSLSHSVSFSLHVELWAVIVASVIALITVLISVMIPLRKALKVNAIDAVRQSGDISEKITGKKVKTSKLTYKVFGFEGMLADKNFRRNKRKYRSTVVSLFMSIVLFISAGSFCAYLTSSVDDVVSAYSFDITYMSEASPEDNVKIYSQLADAKTVTESSFISSGPLTFVDYPQTIIDKGYAEYVGVTNGIKSAPNISFIEDSVYESFLIKNGFDAEKYMNIETPTALFGDFFIRRNMEDKKYYSFNILNSENLTLTGTTFASELDGNVYDRREYTDDDTLYIYKNTETGEEKVYSEQDAQVSISFALGERTEVFPLGNDIYNGSGIVLMYPLSAYDTVYAGCPKSEDVRMYFKADSATEAYEDMIMILENNRLSTADVINYSDSASIQRSLILIVQIFSYGFIVLISLIAAANVFNTISTNIALRRREFAMLKSVGMTQRGFRKMMDYECLLYGLKALLFGIPVAFFFTWLIYVAVNNGYAASFYIPYAPVIISVVSVFAVVFSTMLYSTGKIKNDNPIDALKNENL